MVTATLVYLIAIDFMPERLKRILRPKTGAASRQRQAKYLLRLGHKSPGPIGQVKRASQILTIGISRSNNYYCQKPLSEFNPDHVSTGYSVAYD
ncbi:MAG: hypothetical protein ACYDBJ_25635 [Aggregatilineales bacterium]